LAKTTVSHSQTAIAAVKVTGVAVPPDSCGPPVNGSTTASTVVSAAPTSTTNITGLCHMTRGSSLRRAPGRASRSVASPKAWVPDGAGPVAGSVPG
jgi:hypothetical protein